MFSIGLFAQKEKTNNGRDQIKDVSKDDVVNGNNRQESQNLHIAEGASGVKRSISYRFSKIHDDIPQDGVFRYNSDSVNAVTYIIVDEHDLSGENQSKWFTTWDDTTGATGRGRITVVETDGSIIGVLDISGVMIDKGEFWQIPVKFLSGRIPHDDEVCFYVFERIAGKKKTDEKSITTVIEVEQGNVSADTMITADINLPDPEEETELPRKSNDQEVQTNNQVPDSANYSSVIIELDHKKNDQVTSGVSEEIKSEKTDVLFPQQNEVQDKTAIKEEQRSQDNEPVIITEVVNPVQNRQDAPIEEELVVIGAQDKTNPFTGVITNENPVPEPVIIVVHEEEKQQKPEINPETIQNPETGESIIVVSGEREKTVSAPDDDRVIEEKPVVNEIANHEISVPLAVQNTSETAPVTQQVAPVTGTIDVTRPLKHNTDKDVTPDRVDHSGVERQRVPQEIDNRRREILTQKIPQTDTNRSESTLNSNQDSQNVITSNSKTTSNQKTEANDVPNNSNTVQGTAVNKNIQKQNRNEIGPTGGNMIVSQQNTSTNNQITNNQPQQNYKLPSYEQNNYNYSGYTGHRVWYRGIIELGYGFGTGKYGMNNFRFNFINAIKLNPSSSIGLGIGFRRFYEDKNSGWRPDSGKMQIPVFIDLRTNFSTRTVTPYLAVGIGNSSRYISGSSSRAVYEGLFLNCSGGIWFNISERTALFAGIAYEMQKLQFASADDSRFKEFTRSVSVNIGFSF